MEKTVLNLLKLNQARWLVSRRLYWNSYRRLFQFAQNPQKIPVLEFCIPLRVAILLTRRLLCVDFCFFYCLRCGDLEKKEKNYDKLEKNYTKVFKIFLRVCIRCGVSGKMKGRHLPMYQRHLVNAFHAILIKFWAIFRICVHKRHFLTRTLAFGGILMPILLNNSQRCPLPNFFSGECCKYSDIYENVPNRRLVRWPSSSRSKSNFQNPPFPGSSLDRGTLTKHLFNDKLCRIEFCTNK